MNGAWGHARRRLLAAGSALLLAASGAAILLGGASPASADTAPPLPTTPLTVSNDALPTVQINGVVWAQVTVGNTVYATGSFTSARPAGSPAGTNETPRANLLAYDITTGNLITSFNHSLNAQGKTITASPDGSRVYVGGDFTTVDGVARNRIAAFTTATGALVTTFTAGAAAEVLALTATNSTLYVGGVFGSAGGASRDRLAAFAASNGALLNWAPTADDNQVAALVITPDQSRVIVGGKFTTLNHVAAYGLGAVDATTGATLSWAANAVVRDAGNNAGITSLRTDGTKIYGTGFVFGAGGNMEGTFAASPDSGALIWLQDCHGDSYDVAALAGIVYVVSHEHFCSNIGAWPETSPRSYHRATAFTNYATGTIAHNSQGGYADFFGNPDPTQLDWYPTLPDGTYTGQNQAAWSATGNSSYLALGGEFPSVNGVAQQGLVRFAIKSLAPNKVGPVAAAGLTPTITSPAANSLRIAWNTTWDSDNEALTYKVVRDGNTAGPVSTTTINSKFWQLPATSFTDTGLAPGSTHTYRIYATDPFGNTTAGSTVSGTVQGTVDQPPVARLTPTCTALACSFDGSGSTDPDGTISSYAWTFGDGSTATGRTASHTYPAAGDYTAKLVVTDNLGGTATTTQLLSPRPAANNLPANTPFAVDAFNRTVASGFGTADTGGAWSTSGGAGPRSVSPGTGLLTTAAAGSQTGVYLPAATATDAETDVTLSSNKVGTGNGVYLYVLGRRTGTNAEYRSRIRLQGSGAVGLSLTELNGSATEVTVKPEITLPGVTYTAGLQLEVRFQVVGTNPTTLRVKVWPTTATEPVDWQLTATDSGSALQAAGGIGLTSYLSGSATNAPVVTSVSGLTARPTSSPAPTAAFTATSTGLATSVDASTSTDPGGSIPGYTWSWGDGVVTSGRTSAHTFAQPGTYRITLTVTDAAGYTDVTTRTVTVTA